MKKTYRPRLGLQLEQRPAIGHGLKCNSSTSNNLILEQTDAHNEQMMFRQRALGHGCIAMAANRDLKQ
jgi:hypothetical protein